MALLKVEAERMSNNVLVAGLIEELITINETFGMLPFTQVINIEAASGRKLEASISRQYASSIGCARFQSSIFM